MDTTTEPTQTAELPDVVSNSAQVANFVTEMLPDLAEQFKADTGTAALILCGFLANKIIGKPEDGAITLDQFVSHIQRAQAAFEAVKSGTVNLTKQ